MNIPNLLTVLRVLLIPVFILLFYLPFSWSYWAASAVFAIAAVTDWLDGKHAVFGKVVDANDQKVVDAIEQGDVINTITILED